MSRMDTSAILAKELAGIVQRHVADAVAPLQARIKELEARPVAKDGKDGVSVSDSFKDSEGCLILTLTNGKAIKTEIRDGRNGKDADPIDYERVRTLVDESVARIQVPVNNKSITIDDVRPLIEETVSKQLAAYPKPKDGKDGEGIKEFDTELVEGGKVLLIKVGIGDTLNIHEVPLPCPKDGEPGKSITAEDVRPMLAEMFEALPKPKNGKDADPALIERMVADAVAAQPKPKDGISVSAEELRPMVEEVIGKVVSQMPKPKDGDPGKSVTVEDVLPVIEKTVQQEVAKIPVLKGDPGNSVKIEDVLPAIKSEVERHISAIPVPKDGEDADVGEIVKRLIPEVEKAVSQLTRVVGTDIDKDGNLIVRKSDGGTDNLGRVIGADGAGFENVEALEDELTFGLRFGKGAASKEVRWAKANFADIDQGVWKDGSYKRGTATTFGGSYWLAKRDTNSKPGVDDSWRMIVKRGRDGKDAR